MVHRRAQAGSLTPDENALLELAFPSGDRGGAADWSKFVKQHRAAAPAWFHTVGSYDDGAFPAFIAVGGSADASGAGGGAGGGAAGGGASGAG